MLLRLRALSLCSLLALHAAAWAQVPDEPDRESYMGRPVARTMHWRGADWLLRETREKEEATSLLLEHLGVREGQTVCDLGCGNGYLTLPIARAVGEEGRVLAVDIQPPMLEMLAGRAAEAGLENIETIVAGEADPHLPPGSCDLVVMLDVYHEVGRPESLLRHLRAALAPDGRLCFVEFRAEDPDVPIKREHKMSKAQLLLEMAHNGLRFASEFDGLPWQHLVFFEKDRRDSDFVVQDDLAAYEDALGFDAVAAGFVRALRAGDTRALRGFYGATVDVRPGSELLKEERGGAQEDRTTGAELTGVEVCVRLRGLVDDVGAEAWRQLWAGVPASRVRAVVGPAVAPAEGGTAKRVNEGTVTAATGDTELSFVFARNDHGQWHVVRERSDY
jgi:ubiquinone/menaquinone biosynthesis C-methylase UbiE